jgi:hypothetical protein
LVTRIQGLGPKTEKSLHLQKNNIFVIKNCYLPIPKPP